MNIKQAFFFFTVFFLLIFTNCTNNDTNLGYQTILIGEQMWANKDLSTVTFRNGDTIPLAQTKEEWMNANDKNQPAYGYQEKGDEKGAVFYNWHAVNDARNIAPEGWKVPNNNDWDKLAEELGGKDIAGISMKSKKYGGSGVLSLDFSLPGYREYDGRFVGSIIAIGLWWSTSKSGWAEASSRTLYPENISKLGSYPQSKSNGLSVRLLKDTN